MVLELAGNSFSAIELALSFLPCFELRSLLFFNFSLFANFKCRLGKSQPQLKICSGNNKQEDCREMNNNEGPCSSREESIGTLNEMTESMQIDEALQMQMERYLQLKIEAQGNHLQSVLHKAQETFARMINNGSSGSPPILELTETRGGFNWSCGQRKQNRGTMCSLEIESFLTSFESSMDQRPNNTNTTNTASLELLPLFKESKEQEDETIIRRKRSSSCCVDQPSKMSIYKLVLDTIYLN
ncbi:hypothetical protein AHAS_Ahas09G0136600 [Arachis hypogaea]